MKRLIWGLLILFGCSFKAMSQDNICVFENYQRVELCLIETFSQQWYDDLVDSDINDSHRFFFEVFVDGQGKIVGFGKVQLFGGITPHEFASFQKHFQTNFHLCISPPEDMSRAEFARFHNNRIPLRFFYYPAKMSIFLAQIRKRE
jgi:hypothetical protein